MAHNELSLCLKIVVAVIALFLALVLALFIPMLANRVYEYYSLAGRELTAAVYGWGIPGAVVLSAVPGYVALGLAWRIFTQIGLNNSFCAENAKRLKIISRLALADTVLYAGLSLLILSMGTEHPAVPFIFFTITIFGAAMTIVCAALSHLTQKAADLKADNDLTI